MILVRVRSVGSALTVNYFNDIFWLLRRQLRSSGMWVLIWGQKRKECESMLCAQWLRRGLKQTAGVLGRLWYPLHAHLFTRFLHRCPGRGSFLQGRERRRRAGGCVSQGPLSKAIARGWQLMGPTFLRWQIRILFSKMRMWCPCVLMCVCLCFGWTHHGSHL